ncbi:MAG: tetratricopeptide repeat protein [Burkholderiaceae bacterium]
MPLPPPRCPRLLAVSLAVLVCGHALADELSEVMRLRMTGHATEALDRATRHLAQNPRDAAMRFQQGVLLADSGRPAQAIEVFAQLTQDHPELPEPYNNLAALYASLGEVDKARSALEKALRSHPGYAAAHENLGDIYIVLARRAYARAAELEPTNATVLPKLALLRQLALPGGAAAPR